MTCSRLSRLLILALLGASTIAFADIDRSEFPDGLRAMEWREIGPYRGGRSAAVTGIPGNEQTFYMGTTGGGVWKTLDAGKSWQNVSDGTLVVPSDRSLSPSGITTSST